MDNLEFWKDLETPINYDNLQIDETMRGHKERYANMTMAKLMECENFMYKGLDLYKLSCKMLEKDLRKKRADKVGVIRIKSKHDRFPILGKLKN